MPTVEEVTDALRDVIDPELGLDFVELGLIYDVEVEGGTVRITYTLTSPGCPIGPQVSEQMEEFVSDLDGVVENHDAADDVADPFGREFPLVLVSMSIHQPVGDVLYCERPASVPQVADDFENLCFKVHAPLVDHLAVIAARERT